MEIKGKIEVEKSGKKLRRWKLTCAIAFTATMVASAAYWLFTAVTSLLGK